MAVTGLPWVWRWLCLFSLGTVLLGAGCSAGGDNATGSSANGPNDHAAVSGGTGGAGAAAAGGQTPGPAAGTGGAAGIPPTAPGSGGSSAPGGAGGAAGAAGLGGTGGPVDSGTADGGTPTPPPAAGSAGSAPSGGSGAPDVDAGMGSPEVAGSGGFPGPGGLWSDPAHTASAENGGALTTGEVQACLPQPVEGDTSEEDADRPSCSAANCEALRSCCVGNGTCCTDINVTGVPQMADFSECDGTDPASCLALQGWSAENFGPRPAAVHDGALYPGGDETGDSGLVISSLLDLSSHRIRVSANFGAASSCRDDCLEGVGMGFSSEHELPAHISGDIALVYSGSLGQVRLMLGGNVVAQEPMTEQQERWTLELQPSGRALVFADRADSEAVFDVPYSPKAASRLLLFGRNRDPAADDGASLSELAVQVAVCDIPGGWRDRGAVTIRRLDGREWLPETMASPSVAYDSAGLGFLAIEVDGAIHLARRLAGDDAEFQLLTPTSTPDVTASMVRESLGLDVAALRDPWLLWDGAQWNLYFAVDRGDQGSELAMVRSQPDGTLAPAESLTFDGTVGELDAPSVVLHELGYWVMIARERTTIQQLAIFASLDGLRWGRSAAGQLGPFMSATAAASPDNFHADGVDSPSLSLHNGAWQLYYAGRRGTRWAIGLLVSDDLLLWRHVPAAGPVLAPVGTGFERLAVSQPAAVARDSGVELFYMGSDGHRSQVGRVWRASSDF